MSKLRNSISEIRLSPIQTLEVMLPINPKSVQHGVRTRINPRTQKPLYYNDAEKEKYMKEIIREAKHQLPEKPLEGPLSVGFKFYFERLKKHEGISPYKPIPVWGYRSNDCSNLLKGCEDALTKAGLWVDDAQIQSYDYVERWYAEEVAFPRIEIVVTQYELINVE